MDLDFGYERVTARIVGGSRPNYRADDGAVKILFPYLDHKIALDDLVRLGILRPGRLKSCVVILAIISGLERRKNRIVVSVEGRRPLDHIAPRVGPCGVEDLDLGGVQGVAANGKPLRNIIEVRHYGELLARLLFQGVESKNGHELTLFKRHFAAWFTNTFALVLLSFAQFAPNFTEQSRLRKRSRRVCFVM